MSGPLLTMSQFDAYASAFEHALPAFVSRHNTADRYYTHPKWQNPPGTYTDDTQMCLALAGLMLDTPPDEWTPYKVVGAFTDQFKRDPRPGYAGGFYKFLKTATSKQFGTDYFIRHIKPHSDKSGGAMRAPVIGFIPDLSRVIDLAMFQASVTHATYSGMLAAAASAVATHLLYYRKTTREHLANELGAILPGWRNFYDPMYDRKIGSKGWQSVSAALHVLWSHNSLTDMLRAVTAMTGDTDTAAAMLGFWASLCDDVDQDLDPSLYNDLEDGPFGRSSLELTDQELAGQYVRPDVHPSPAE